MFIAQCFETMQWPHLQGSMVKQTTGPLTLDNEVTSLKTLGKKHLVTELNIAEDQGSQNY
jgi:hypothetical protein